MYSNIWCKIVVFLKILLLFSETTIRFRKDNWNKMAFLRCVNIVNNFTAYAKWVLLSCLKTWKVSSKNSIEHKTWFVLNTAVSHHPNCKMKCRSSNSSNSKILIIQPILQLSLRLHEASQHIVAISKNQENCQDFGSGGQNAETS